MVFLSMLPVHPIYNLVFVGKKKISPIIPLCLSSHDPLPLVHFWGLFSKNTAGSRRARPNPATPIRLLKSMLYFQSSHLPSHFQGTKVDHHICFLACGAHSGPESWADIFLLPVIHHLCSSVIKVSNTLKAREFPFCVANWDPTELTNVHIPRPNLKQHVPVNSLKSQEDKQKQAGSGEELNSDEGNHKSAFFVLTNFSLRARPIVATLAKTLIKNPQSQRDKYHTISLLRGI